MWGMLRDVDGLVEVDVFTKIGKGRLEVGKV